MGLKIPGARARAGSNPAARTNLSLKNWPALNLAENPIKRVEIKVISHVVRESVQCSLDLRTIVHLSGLCAQAR